jgi:hypothetical protein
MNRLPLALVLLCLSASSPLLAEPTGSDPRAVEIARAVLERLGGQEAWDDTRFVHWKFFGGRSHDWDKQTGDVRMEIPERRSDDGALESPELLILMNVGTRQGNVWAAGEPVGDEQQAREYLDRGHKIWINDSYWMFMPYKLLDPGVTLRYAGERALEDGRAADVLDLTFDAGVGYTPQNRYEVLVARDSGLIEAWSFFAEADEKEPRFTMPWAGWKQFGQIWLATEHGQGKDWEISVEDQRPRTIFTE